MSLIRDKLREQNALSEEIVNAITGNNIGESIDEDELDAELEELQQEQLDEQMLKTGTVPVSDQIQRVPAVPAGDSKLYQVSIATAYTILIALHSQGQDSGCRRGRRRRGAAQAAGGNGYVRSRPDIMARQPEDSTTTDRTARNSHPPVCEDGLNKLPRGGNFDFYKLRLVCCGGSILLLALAYGGWVITRNTRRMAYHCSEVLFTISQQSCAGPLLLLNRACTISALWPTLRSIRDPYFIPCIAMTGIWIETMIRI